MNRRAALGGICLLLAAGPLSGQTADAILARHMEAEGGLQKAGRVHAIRLKGTLEIGPGQAFPFKLEASRPNRIRVESRAPDGLVYLRLYDGQTGFQFDETGRLYQTSDRDAAAERSGGFCDFLLDPAAKGVRVEFLEHQAVAGRDAYRMRFTRAGGLVTTHWIDTQTFLELQREEERDTPQGRRTFVTRFSDFRLVEGMPISFHREISVRFSSQTRIFQVTEVELNPDLPDGDFSLAPSR